MHESEIVKTTKVGHASRGFASPTESAVSSLIANKSVLKYSMITYERYRASFGSTISFVIIWLMRTLSAHVGLDRQGQASRVKWGERSYERSPVGHASPFTPLSSYDAATVIFLPLIQARAGIMCNFSWHEHVDSILSEGTKGKSIDPPPRAPNDRSMLWNPFLHSQNLFHGLTDVILDPDPQLEFLEFLIWCSSFASSSRFSWVLRDRLQKSRILLQEHFHSPIPSFTLTFILKLILSINSTPNLSSGKA